MVILLKSASGTEHKQRTFGTAFDGLDAETENYIRNMLANDEAVTGRQE